MVYFEQYVHYAVQSYQTLLLYSLQLRSQNITMQHIK